MTGTPGDATFNYGGTGSGAGLRGVMCNSAVQVAGSALSGSTIVAPVSGDTIHFGASDAVMSTQQYTRWNASLNVAGSAGSACNTTEAGGTLGAAQGGPLIQIPMLGTPITLAFNLPDPLSRSGRLTLTDDQICRIFSGNVTNWNQLTNAATSALPSLAIRPTYRSDGSGTTFLLTSHLAAVCNGTAGAIGPAGAITFSGVQTFASLYPSGSLNPTGVLGYFLGGAQSSGVQAQIGINALNAGGTATGTSGAIGYLSPDYTTVAPANSTLTNTFPPVAGVVNSISGATVLPNTANTSAALNTGNSQVPTGTALADPRLWVPSTPNPSVGYPIVGYTVWVFPTCYQTTNAEASVRTYVNQLISSSTYRNVILNNGFIPPVTSLRTAINTHLLSESSAGVNIGNRATCASSSFPGAITGTIVGR